MKGFKYFKYVLAFHASIQEDCFPGIKPVHIAIYHHILHAYNKAGSTGKTLRFSNVEVRKGSGIKSRNTYYAALEVLTKFKLVEVREFGQGQFPIIIPLIAPIIGNGDKNPRSKSKVGHEIQNQNPDYKKAIDTEIVDQSASMTFEEMMKRKRSVKDSG